MNDSFLIKWAYLFSSSHMTTINNVWMFLITRCCVWIRSYARMNTKRCEISCWISRVMRHLGADQCFLCLSFHRLIQFVSDTDVDRWTSKSYLFAAADPSIRSDQNDSREKKFFNMQPTRLDSSFSRQDLHDDVSFPVLFLFFRQHTKEQYREWKLIFHWLGVWTDLIGRFIEREEKNQVDTLFQWWLTQFSWKSEHVVSVEQICRSIE